MVTFLGVVFIYVSAYQKETYLMEVTYLNIGQGDATLVRMPDQSLYLIDVSAGPQILEALSKELSYFQKNIKGVFLTHMDADHISGIVPVLEYYDVETIFVSAFYDEESLYATVSEFIEKNAQDVVIQKLSGTEKIIINEEKEILFDILFPIANYPFQERNDRSLVIHLRYGENTFLFTGDASVEIEEYLVQEVAASLEADVLQVGHHGSKTSTAEVFLKTVRPEYAIISAGEDNDFGHPHNEVVARLEDLEIVMLETKGGNQTFVTDGKTVLLQ